MSTQELAQRATPKQAKRFEIFNLNKEDLDRLVNKERTKS